jgi:hypothetical protein
MSWLEPERGKQGLTVRQTSTYWGRHAKRLLQLGCASDIVVRFFPKGRNVVPVAGLEPATDPFREGCSVQLSYTGTGRAAIKSGPELKLG